MTFSHQDHQSTGDREAVLDGAYKTPNGREAPLANGNSSDISSRETAGQRAPGTISQAPMTNGFHEAPSIPTANLSGQGALEVICGPLLNYKRMDMASTGSPTWHGSVLIVATQGSSQPSLQLHCMTDGRAQGSQNSTGLNGPAGHTSTVSRDRTLEGVKLYADSIFTFWRFDLVVPILEEEAHWQYSIPNMKYVGTRPRSPSPSTFVVPAASQSMRIMFHSCNGFSVGTDEEAWSGPALWNDVLRAHEAKPFHVMIGGGDQIYNDGVRVTGPLKEWTDIGNPIKRRQYPFGETMRAGCDQFYFDNYVKWFSTPPFSTANSQIPQINVWDDHGETIDELPFHRSAYLCG